MPKLLNKSTDEIPTDAVYIGRPGPWGNPFVVGVHGSRRECVESHRLWFLSQPDLVARAKKELIGRDLVCHCRPKLCHGSILLSVSNSGQRRKLFGNR